MGEAMENPTDQEIKDKIKLLCDKKWPYNSQTHERLKKIWMAVCEGKNPTQTGQIIFHIALLLIEIKYFGYFLLKNMLDVPSIDEHDRIMLARYEIYKERHKQGIKDTDIYREIYEREFPSGNSLERRRFVDRMRKWKSRKIKTKRTECDIDLWDEFDGSNFIPPDDLKKVKNIDDAMRILSQEYNSSNMIREIYDLYVKSFNSKDEQDFRLFITSTMDHILENIENHNITINMINNDINI